VGNWSSSTALTEAFDVGLSSIAASGVQILSSGGELEGRVSSGP